MLEAGSDTSACADPAQTTLDEVSNAVNERQAILDGLSTGHECPSLESELVAAYQKTLTDAQTAKTNADQAAAAAAAAQVHFAPQPLSQASVTAGECSSLFSDPAYTT